MVQTLTKVDHPAAQGKQFTAGDLNDGQVVDEGRFVQAATVQGDKANAYGAGAGPQNDTANTDGWSDLDMKVTPDGGTTVNDASGRFRFEVYADPNQEDLVAKSRTFPAGALRAAVSAGLREKILIPAMLEEMAGEDAHLTLAYKAASGEDGSTIYRSGSSSELGVAYSEL